MYRLRLLWTHILEMNQRRYLAQYLCCNLSMTYTLHSILADVWNPCIFFRSLNLQYNMSHIFGKLSGSTVHCTTVYTVLPWTLYCTVHCTAVYSALYSSVKYTVQHYTVHCTAVYSTVYSIIHTLYSTTNAYCTALYSTLYSS